MPDVRALPPIQTSTWRDRVAPGDIVSFLYPYSEDATPEVPKARPSLVLEIIHHAAENTTFALLAYGTTSPRRYDVHDVLVPNRGVLPVAGLDRDTVFTCSRRLMVSLRSSLFAESAATGSPVLGSLTGAVRQRMDAVQRALARESERAAAHRDAREVRHLGRSRPRPRCLAAHARPAPLVERRRPTRRVDLPGRGQPGLRPVAVEAPPAVPLTDAVAQRPGTDAEPGRATLRRPILAVARRPITPDASIATAPFSSILPQGDLS